MSPPLVEARGLGFARGGATILHDVDLAVAPGEIVTLVGPNGSGKSTLLRLLIGALAPKRGRVTRAAGLRLGYVPQRLAIGPAMPLTLGGFLALAGASRAAAALALARVGAEGLEAKQLSVLSGGQFQRALLAQALIGAPQLLVLDEAAQGLDQPGIAGFYRLIAALRADLGCAVLMVSHDLHVVMAASDRVVCLNGHICCAGTPTVVSAAPEYHALFGTRTQGALALYRHEHDHAHAAEPGEG